MNYLADTSIGFAPTKEQLAKAIDSTPNTVAIELTRLGKVDYITENKGRYTITPTGRAAYEQDPMLSMLKNGKETTVSESPFYIDWDYIKNNRVCWAVMGAEFPESFNYNKLLPVVIIYLNHIKYQMPIVDDPDNKPPHDKTSEKELEVLSEYITNLIATCG